MSIALDEFNSCELLRISSEICEWLGHKLHPLHIFSLLKRLCCSNRENRPHKSLERKILASEPSHKYLKIRDEI